MNERKYIEKQYLQKGVIVFLLLFGFLFQNKVEGQTTTDSTSNIVIDASTIKIDSALSFEKDSQNLIQKILRPLKFRDNRNRKELDRVYQFMLGLVKKGELHIDSSTVDEIILHLDTISSISLSNTQSIDTIFKKNELYQKASKAVLDSIKSQISAVITEIEDKNKIVNDIPELQNIDDNYLKEIRNIQYANEAGFEALDSMEIGNAWNYFHKKLKPKINVIGWHNSWNETEYMNYNYAYLSSINLYGYELSSNGKVKNPAIISEFEKPGGVIELAAKKNCDVHLTIYSKLPSDITKFLNSRTAQNTMLSNVETLINRNKLKGINIYFEGFSVKDRQAFSQFILKLRQNLNTINDSIQLNISIPTVGDLKSLSEINAYNFFELNPYVDFYMVLTDNLTSLNNNTALTFSPLYNSDSYGQRTVESSINFYSNGKIPLSKLVPVLSYLGIQWPVDDFLSGTVKKGKAGSHIKYNNIINEYKNIQLPGRTVEVGFDSVQVAAKLNVSNLGSYKTGEITKTQIWFENSNSLIWKYNWILQRDLGGVAIRGLGYDDGYSELWDALGTTLLKIDTVYLNNQISKTCQCEYDSLHNLSTELKLSNWKELYTGLINTRNISNDSSFVNLFLADYNLAKKADLKYNCGTPGKSTVLLENEKVCRDLLSRWYLYSRILFGLTIIFLLLAGTLIFWRNNLERFKFGSANAHLILIIGIWLFFLLALVALLLGLFFEPSLDSIGAGNKGDSNFWILVKTAGVGVALGILLKLSMNKNKFRLKNQP